MATAMGLTRAFLPSTDFNSRNIKQRCITGNICRDNKLVHKKKAFLRVRSEAIEDASIDNSTVLVVGGGGIGMEVVRKLAKDGSWVTVLQRTEKFRKEVESLGAMLSLGDVLDIASIAKPFAMNSFDAVVCTVGGGTQNPTVDQDGTINVINAAVEANVKRFVLVSSIGVGDSVQAIDAKTLETLGAVLKAKGVAEEYLKRSSLLYTIIRPGGLTNDPPTGKGILTKDTNVVGLISRSDVACIIAQLLFDKRAWLKTYSAFDSQRLFPPTHSLDGINVETFS